jgi:UDP-3-O-[3-hydroxymyristoyl] glucosamine N-acyltransferase
MFYLKKEILASELAHALNLEYKGLKDFYIKAVDKLDTVGEGGLSFSKGKEATKSQTVLISKYDNQNNNLIISQNPRLDFIRCLHWLNSNIGFVSKEANYDIHSSAQISKSAVIEANVSIGEGCIVEHNVVIHSGTRIGKNTIIRANSVIGAQGFGFEKLPNGEYIRFPHLGAVVIGNNVEIGALNSICIGALGNTVIADGVKTDNLVHIAHNCIIGKNSIITACAELSGGVELGEGVWLGPNCSTMQKIKIGNNSLVGLGATVTKDVTENVIVAGSPAKIIRTI